MSSGRAVWRSAGRVLRCGRPGAAGAEAVPRRGLPLRLLALARAVPATPRRGGTLAFRRGGRRPAFGREAVRVAHVDLPVDEPLDRAQERAILAAHERERFARGA